MVNRQEIYSKEKLPKPLFPKLNYKSSHFHCHCGFAFSSKISLRVHCSEFMEMSNRIRPTLSMAESPIPVILARPNPSAMIADTQTYKCDPCEKTFATEQGLNRHIGRIHNRKKKLAKCTVCNKKFTDKYAVKIHMNQVHEGANRVFCQLCGADFYNKYVYKKHTKICPERIKMRDSYVGN